LEDLIKKEAGLAGKSTNGSWRLRTQRLITFFNFFAIFNYTAKIKKG
jgi:hypothetical protein